MIKTRIENRSIHLNSFFLILFFFFGLLGFQGIDYNKFDSDSHSTQTEIIIIKNSATGLTGIQNYHFQKTWIPNKDKFKILSFDKSQFLDSNKVDQRIFLSEEILKKYIRLPISFNLHLLFPHQSDEIPILS